MRKLACILGVAALAGCNVPTDAALVASANATLVKIAPTISVACGVIGVAEGYYANVKSRVSPSVQAAEAKAANALAVICANPPSNIAAAFSDLAAEWAVIQQSTTVP